MSACKACAYDTIRITCYNITRPFNAIMPYVSHATITLLDHLMRFFRHVNMIVPLRWN